MDDSLDLDERFFADHKFEPSIGIAEYELASRKLDGEEKAFLWATNMSSVFIPLVWYVGIRARTEWPLQGFSEDILPVLILIYLLFSASISLMAIGHITKLLKSKIFSERKIILLRRAMGVRYGQNSMVLPNWRLEGADNPFSMKMFPGFFSYPSFPIFIVVAFPAISFLLLFDQASPLFAQFLAISDQSFNVFNTEKISNISTPSQSAIIAACLWSILGLLKYRLNLREHYENTWLWAAKSMSAILGIPMVNNIEYKIYRCKLEIAEANRIGAAMGVIKPLALAIEDKEFYSHSGVNWKGIGRAIIQFFREGRRSGGSSITQQCARSNFLTTMKPAFARKLVETLLAKWLESVLTKEEILRIYLTTARFDYKVYGFHRAYAHFFDEPQNELTQDQAFILIERLGNTNGRFLSGRVKIILERLVEEKSLDKASVLIILASYEALIRDEKINKVTGETPNEIATGFTVV